MKISINIIILLLSISFTSCEKNLMENVESGAWNNEKSILNIKFSNQLGAPSIIRDSITGAGEISFFFLDTLNINDLNLKIEQLNLSYGATANVKVGDVLSFAKDSLATISVTSQTGQSKIWTIRLKVFEDIIIGVWNIKFLWLHGGMSAAYGGTYVYDMSKIAEMKKTALPPTKEYDNILTFTLVGVKSNGDSYGTVNNDAGLDGAYADFIYTGTGTDTIADVNKFYRKIPKGISNWSKNVSKNTITFTPIGGGISSTCTYIEAGTTILDGYKSITIVDKALRFDLDQPGLLRTRYTTRNKVVDSPQKFFIEIKKQSK